MFVALPTLISDGKENELQDILNVGGEGETIAEEM